MQSCCCRQKNRRILAAYGLKTHLIPEKYVAESLLEALFNVVKKEDHVLIPHGNLARNVISEGLRELWNKCNRTSSL
ncbi:uroporphyrinogen-III synthase [Anaerobacillus sp. HL2]|nr:uroporphyrinogen-III synthase [Anaerobacillus sp. HL2]